MGTANRQPHKSPDISSPEDLGPGGRVLVSLLAFLIFGGIGIALWSAIIETWSGVPAGRPIASTANRTSQSGLPAPQQPLSMPTQALRMAQEAVEIDPQATLNPSFRDLFGRGAAHIPQSTGLSAAGYPVIEIEKAMGVCADPTSVRLASDLIRSGRSADINSLPTCMVLERGQRAEWTNPNPFDDGLQELRLRVRSIVPKTFYGPSRQGNDDRFHAWFLTFERR